VLSWAFSSWGGIRIDERRDSLGGGATFAVRHFELLPPAATMVPAVILVISAAPPANHCRRANRAANAMALLTNDGAKARLLPPMVWARWRELE